MKLTAISPWERLLVTWVVLNGSILEVIVSPSLYFSTTHVFSETGSCFLHMVPDGSFHVWCMSVFKQWSQPRPQHIVGGLDTRRGLPYKCLGLPASPPQWDPLPWVWPVSLASPPPAPPLGPPAGEGSCLACWNGWPSIKRAQGKKKSWLVNSRRGSPQGGAVEHLASLRKCIKWLIN